MDVFASQGSAIAQEAIARIALLYAVEDKARGLAPTDRVALRQAEAKPVFDDLELWLHDQLPKLSGKSTLAGAIRYALGRMKKVRPYLDNGFLEIDNNTAERAVKPIALGRKNWMELGCDLPIEIRDALSRFQRIGYQIIPLYIGFWLKYTTAQETAF